MADIPILLVAAAILGAGLNVVRGHANDPSKQWSLKKITGGLITAVLGSLALISVLDVTNIGGPIALVVLGLITGFGADFALAKAKA